MSAVRPCAAPQDDRGTDEAHSDADGVPPIRFHSFRHPQPAKRRENVDPAIRGIGAARVLGFDQGLL